MTNEEEQEFETAVECHISLSIRPSQGARGEEILDGEGGGGEEKGRPDTKPFRKSCDTSKIWMWQ